MLCTAVSYDDMLIHKIAAVCAESKAAEFVPSPVNTSESICVFADVPEDELRRTAENVRKSCKNAILICCVRNKEQAFIAADCADLSAVFPMTEDKIMRCIAKASLLSKEQKSDIFIRTFGFFDVFVGGHAINFTNVKAKELLALCVDKRGGAVSQELAIDTLWEHRVCDENTKRLYRKAVIYLRSVLKSAGAEKLFQTGRGFCRIDPETAECDYYNYIDHAAGEPFGGEYMAQYSWGEQTLAMLYFASLGHSAADNQ